MKKVTNSLEMELKEVEKQLYDEVKKYLKDKDLSSAVEYGLTPLYGPLMNEPDMALLTFQGAGSNRVIQEKPPAQLLYLSDNEHFGNRLRKNMNECGLYDILRKSTVAHALIFAQAPMSEAPKWLTSQNQSKKFWRDFSIKWTKKLLFIQNPKIIIIFGRKVYELLEDIKWNSKTLDLPHYGEGEMTIYKENTGNFKTFKVIYCHHLSGSYTKGHVIKCFNKAKELITKNY